MSSPFAMSTNKTLDYSSLNEEEKQARGWIMHQIVKSPDEIYRERRNQNKYLKIICLCQNEIEAKYGPRTTADECRLHLLQFFRSFYQVFKDTNSDMERYEKAIHAVSDALCVNSLEYSTSMASEETRNVLDYDDLVGMILNHDERLKSVAPGGFQEELWAMWKDENLVQNLRDCLGSLWEKCAEYCLKYQDRVHLSLSDPCLEAMSERWFCSPVEQYQNAYKAVDIPEMVNQLLRHIIIPCHQATNRNDEELTKADECLVNFLDFFKWTFYALQDTRYMEKYAEAIYLVSKNLSQNYDEYSRSITSSGMIEQCDFDNLKSIIDSHVSFWEEYEGETTPSCDDLKGALTSFWWDDDLVDNLHQCLPSFWKRALRALREDEEDDEDESE